MPKVVTGGWAVLGGQTAGLSRAITDRVADGHCVTDSDGSIVDVNPSGLRMLGYDADELIGRNLDATLHHGRPTAPPIPIDDRPLVDVRSTAATPVTAETCFWRKDGSMLAVVCSSSPVRLASGTGSVVVFRDVSAQRGSFRRSEALHRTLIANLPDTSVFLLDHDLRVLVADGEAIRQLPWLDDDMFRGRKVSELYADVPSDVLALSLESYRAALRGERRAFEFDSEGLTFAVQAVPVRAEDGSVQFALVVARDITRRTRAARQLARHARQHNAVAELGRFALQTHDLNALTSAAVACASTTLDVDVAGVMKLDEDGETLSLMATTEVSEHEIGAQQVSLAEYPIAAHVLRTGNSVVVENMATETRFTSSPTLLALGYVSSLCVAIGGRDGPFGILCIHAREPRVFAEDEVAFITGVARLITVGVERHREEQTARHAALHDPLTGLPNRALALDRIAQALARRRRDGSDLVVFALDLDRFKVINDTFGHAAGDDVLLAVAPRLTAAVRPTDTVARLGGDEFVVICVGVDGVRHATELADRLAAAISQPLVLDSSEHHLTASTGITMAAGPHDTPRSLLHDADAAMYRAKQRGRGRYELFDEAMRTEIMIRARTETELRQALDDGEFKVWYQPVIDLGTGRPVSTRRSCAGSTPSEGSSHPARSSRSPRRSA